MNSLEQELVQLGAGGHTLAQQVLGNRDDAADAVHDVIAKVLEKPERYNKQKGPLKPWFLTLVRNRCFDMLKSHGRGSVPYDEKTNQFVTDPDSMSDAIEREDAKNQIQRALEKLETNQRQLIVLRDYLDLSYADIARVLEAPKGTVMSRLHRARLALKKAYEELEK